MFNWFKKSKEPECKNSLQDVSFQSAKQLLYPVSFSRYTDCNKNQTQLDSWKKSNDFFKEKKYLEAFSEFFIYLNNPVQNSIVWENNNNKINFEITHGSKIIRGYADEKVFSAEAKIACFDKPGVAFMRSMMNLNYILKYTRFALHENCIYLKFDSKAIDASPNKLYVSLKELCLEADKQDDLFVTEFSSLLKPVETAHLIQINDTEKEVKHKYFLKWIKDTLAKISEWDEERMNGAISFLLLRLAFKIDALIVPQGKLSYDLEKMQTSYFAKDNKSPVEKARFMRDEFKRISELPKEELFQSLYSVKSTFGIVQAATHKQVYEFMLDEFSKTDWYKTNNYPEVVQAVYEYIAGYCLFNFGLYEATKDFLLLFYNILEQEFFNELGMKERFYDKNSNKFYQDEIRKKIKLIVNTHKTEFPKLDFMDANLVFTSMNEFLFSYLNEITYLNFSK